MIKKKNILLFVLMLLASGFIGGTGSFLLGLGQEPLERIWTQLMHWIAANVWIPMAASMMLLMGVGSLLFLAGRRRYRKLENDPEADIALAVDPLLDWGVACVSLEGIILLLFYTICTQFSKDPPEKGWPLSLIIFLIGVFGALLLELSMLRFVHKIHPGRAGDPLSMRYAEQWLQSCDELEKRIAYLSAYKTMMGLRYVLMALTLLMMLMGIFFPVGVAPFLVIITIWIYMSISNLVTSHRLSKSGKVE